MIVTCASCSKSNRLPAARVWDRAKCASCKNPLLPPARPIAVGSAQDFEELVRDAPAPVLVDFWAAWCGPCRAMAPIFEQAATELEPDVRLVKVDSDAVPELLQRFSIQSIPTLMLVHRGREIARRSGVMPLPQLLAWTREHVEGVKA